MNTLGEAIRVARRALAMTQSELAERVGMTQAALSRIERGDRFPASDDIESIADALHVTPEFLSKAALRSPLAVEAHMRRRASASAAQWKTAEAQLNMLRAQVAALADTIDINPALYLPAVDPESVSPEAAASLVRDQWHMPIGPVQNLARWMEAAGIVIIEMPLGTRRIDGLSQRIGSVSIVILNSEAPTDRKRLTMAHELGHLVMHGEYASVEAESEANRFAAELLVPSAAIKPYLRSITLARLFDLKQEWMVSAQALLERAFTLKYVTREERTKLYKELARRGWRINEPFSADLPEDEPSFLGHIIASMSAAGLDDSEIAARALVQDDNPVSLLRFKPDRGLRLVSSQ